MFQSRRSQAGINVVEILIVISILALTLTFGIPGFQDLRVRSDRSAAMTELISAVRLARSEAALRAMPISVCSSSDGVSCSGSDDWSAGWLVFQDPDQDTVVEDSAQIIKVVRFEHTRFSMTADQAIGGAITFGTFGFSIPAAGEFSYQDDYEARDIALTYVGRLHVTQADVEPAS